MRGSVAATVSPDGRRLAVSGLGSAGWSSRALWIQPVAGTSEPEPLLEGPAFMITEWSPDGRYLLGTTQRTDTAHDITYVEIDDPDNSQTLRGEIERAIAELRPERLLCTEPGDWRVRRAFEDAAATSGVAAEVLPDAHFLTSTAEFAGWVEGRRRIRMEDFYRWQRRRLGILVDDDGQPEGGRWNFDADNRKPFGRKGPEVRTRSTFSPDALTRKVIETVRRELPDLPGRGGEAARADDRCARRRRRGAAVEGAAR